MTIASVIYHADLYHSALRCLAWSTAGWLVIEQCDHVYVFGPPSIRGSIDRDILDMTGCLDAQL